MRIRWVCVVDPIGSERREERREMGMVYTVEGSVISAMDTARRDRFRRDVLAEGGGTQTVDGGAAPVSGFMVSVARAETVIPLSLFVSHGCEALRKFERRNAGLLGRDGAYLGAWVNDGNVYLDVSYHFEDEVIARAQGEAEKQLAIYDIANGREVRL